MDSIIEGLQQILPIADAVIQGVIGREKFSGGGVLCVADKASGAPWFVYRAGALASNHFLALYGLTQMAVDDLRQNPGCIANSETDPTEFSKRSSAVRTENFIFAFAGFEPAINEAIVLAVAVEACEMSSLKAERVALQHKNTYLGNLRRACAV